jgi:hypothetical protein
LSFSPRDANDKTSGARGFLHFVVRLATPATRKSLAGKRLHLVPEIGVPHSGDNIPGFVALTHEKAAAKPE